MFLSEWREFPSAPCLAEKKNCWHFASRWCWNRALPWHASELVSFLVGLRTYQHPGGYPARKSHLFCATLCHLWRVWLYIFTHYLINGTILRKKLLYIKCVFRFSLQLLYETFLILRRIQRDIIINVHRSSRQVPVILVRFYGDLNFLDRFSKKRSDMRFHENPSGGGRVLCGQMDGQAWRS